MTPAFAVELFVWSNLAFLGVDIALAHAENGYARGEEWLPIFFSAAAALLLLPALLSARLRQRMRVLLLVVGGAAILIGAGGMIYHLSSAFFERQTLANLVYAAPFVAPLAYVGVGLLLILSRLEPPDSPAWSGWVLLLALGGFAGNFALALLDHAQNGFRDPMEWLAVAAAAYGASFLFMAMLRPADRALAWLTLAVLALEAAIGGIGFVLHFLADAHRPGAGWMERLLHGAPLFAPLLYGDLAVLGAIGLWSRLRSPVS
jgi:hypothetical protein